MLGILLAVIITLFVGRLVLREYKPQAVLMFGGIILMVLAVVFKLGGILPEDKSTGLVWFDIFEFMKNTFSKTSAGLGLTIMAVGGFAKYMSNIGASQALVKLTIKPLRKMNAPYVVLAVGYMIGQLLNVFIPSASGLGVLLMVTMYPILVSLGVSPLAATAMIGTTACLDLGPASGNANLAATTAGIDVSIYFVKYQLPVAIATILTISILHYFVQKRFDKKSGYDPNGVHNVEIAATIEDNEVPKIYAILPMVPLVLILIFSKLLVKSVKMHVVTAMLISLFISMIFEYIRHKDAKKVFASLQNYFDGMGTQFAKVVTLVVAGQTFAQGLKSIGAINTVIESSQSAGFGSNIMMIIMTAIIAVSAILMGSGNAPFFAFAALAPEVAAKLAIPAVLMLLPMQLAAGIARSVSPITGVIVAVAGISNVSPIEVVKRTAIPMAGALLVTVAANYILF
ncbi:C4-dicarboxylate ABC transporter [Crassaminicella thermophila]|uniref:C4-dicarboxylate ABC transporter n=1 Tax=Crassaminicella thermophila TaxID=2599308 RepID=A0A5C0SH29_CRATE|nr:C4-dicarboxylate transporter DcuC [Crassaminicella thermophila]QEK13036.1 C4-dicarboxylate ABC transporter [Crassaminicella thermophila]